MNFSNLTDDNVLLYAVKAYDNPICIMSEFESDYKRVKYIKRLIRRYKQTGELKERNILNHLIVFYNVFGIEPATRILFFKIDKKDYDVLKSFLSFLNYLPAEVQGIKGISIDTQEIASSNTITEVLRVATSTYTNGGGTIHRG